MITKTDESLMQKLDSTIIGQADASNFMIINLKVLGDYNLAEKDKSNFFKRWVNMAVNYYKFSKIMDDVYKKIYEHEGKPLNLFDYERNPNLKNLTTKALAKAIELDDTKDFINLSKENIDQLANSLYFRNQYIHEYLKNAGELLVEAHNKRDILQNFKSGEADIIAIAPNSYKYSNPNHLSPRILGPRILGPHVSIELASPIDYSNCSIDIEKAKNLMDKVYSDVKESIIDFAKHDISKENMIGIDFGDNTINISEDGLSCAIAIAAEKYPNMNVAVRNFINYSDAHGPFFQKNGMFIFEEKLKPCINRGIDLYQQLKNKRKSIKDYILVNKQEITDNFSKQKVYEKTRSKQDRVLSDYIKSEDKLLINTNNDISLNNFIKTHENNVSQRLLIHLALKHKPEFKELLGKDSTSKRKIVQNQIRQLSRQDKSLCR